MGWMMTEGMSGRWRFLTVFTVAVAVLAVLRRCSSDETEHIDSSDSIPSDSMSVDSLTHCLDSVSSVLVADSAMEVAAVPYYSSKVWSFVQCFNDSNDIQLKAAEANGIGPLRCRAEIDGFLSRLKLINITGSPYYEIDELTHSVPYLVPRAYVLLNSIGLAFMDSLEAKGMAPHKIFITSVMRTQEDVRDLQKGNINSTTNSCHCYGTTVDITYNRFIPVLPDGSGIDHPVRWDAQLKMVLAEVLYDMRERGLCYVKYERRQACFHLTVRRPGKD